MRDATKPLQLRSWRIALVLLLLPLLLAVWIASPTHALSVPIIGDPIDLITRTLRGQGERNRVQPAAPVAHEQPKSLVHSPDTTPQAILPGPKMPIRVGGPPLELVEAMDSPQLITPGKRVHTVSVDTVEASGKTRAKSAVLGVSAMKSTERGWEFFGIVWYWWVAAVVLLWFVAHAASQYLRRGYRKVVS